jgi:pyruvate,water dikinase
MSPTQLFDGARELMGEAVHYLTIMQLGAMPLAAQSEGIFSGIYNRWIKKEGDPPAPTFLLGFDSKPIRGEKDLYDLSQWVNEHPALSKYLQETPTEQLADLILKVRENGSISLISPAGIPEAEWNCWVERFQEYLSKYGHTIYDMDFVNPVPADDPAPLIEMLKLYLGGKVKNPSERQSAFIARREAAEKEVMSRLGPIRNWLFSRPLKRAQYHAPIREESIADIGLGYPIMRAMLHELGDRFVRAGALQQPDEIYWLKERELEKAVQSLEQGEALNPQTQVAERRAVWRAANRVTAPPQIPEKLRVLGLDLSKWLPTHEGEQTGNQIKGLGASPGKVTAPACVLIGPDDFEKMKLGDVLVATITTPAWTPLFARASAVVTDIGGPLSHGSIVAREYGIPAVLGTGVATRRIRDGQLVTVNGDAGIVTLDRDEEEA